MEGGEEKKRERERGREGEGTSVVMMGEHHVILAH